MSLLIVEIAGKHWQGGKLLSWREVGRARMLAGTLKGVASACGTEGAWRPAWGWGMLIGTTDSPLSLLLFCGK